MNIPPTSVILASCDELFQEEGFFFLFDLDNLCWVNIWIWLYHAWRKNIKMAFLDSPTDYFFF